MLRPASLHHRGERFVKSIFASFLEEDIAGNDVDTDVLGGIRVVRYPALVRPRNGVVRKFEHERSTYNSDRRVCRCSKRLSDAFVRSIAEVFLFHRIKVCQPNQSKGGLDHAAS